MSIERRTSRDLFALEAEHDELEAQEDARAAAAHAANPQRFRWTFGLSGWLPSAAEDDFVLA